MNRLTAALSATLAIGVFVAAVVAAYALGHTAATETAQSADITVMPCSAWANGATPEPHPYSLTDACVDPSGTLHTAPSSAWKTR